MVNFIQVIFFVYIETTLFLDKYSNSVHFSKELRKFLETQYVNFY